MYAEELYISDYHGMELWPIADDITRFNENGILFLVEYYFNKHIAKTLTHGDIAQIQIIIENLRTYDTDGNKIRGLFDRGAGESKWENKKLIRTISHDNITAIAAFSYLLADYGFSYHKQIATHGERYFWRFDNVYLEKPRWERIQHPRDIVYWSYLGGRLWAKLFIWYPVLECILSCWKHKEDENGALPTSGKCLSFVRLYPIRNKLVGKLGWKICTYFVEKVFDNGWDGVFAYYFKNPDHPINLIVTQNYLKDEDLW